VRRRGSKINCQIINHGLLQQKSNIKLILSYTVFQYCNCFSELINIYLTVTVKISKKKKKERKKERDGREPLHDFFPINGPI
jgi:hypothetical protein